MKRLYKVETTFRKQSYVFYVYAKSECHAFNLVLKDIHQMYGDPIYMYEFSNTTVGLIFNFLK